MTDEPGDGYAGCAGMAEGYLRWALHGHIEDHEAWEAVTELAWSGDFERLWEVVQVLARADYHGDDTALATVAAGPVEDLLKGAGGAFIDRIEAEAARNPQFGRLLTGVWLTDADPALLARLLAILARVTNPIDGPPAG